MPIDRAHGRLIGPQGMVRYPDDFVKTHKRVKRSGWWVAGIDDPESVAEHSYRTALLGYILASLEGADPTKNRDDLPLS